MADQDALKKRIAELVLEQVDRDEERRGEAVSDYITLTAGVEPDKARQVAGLVPPVQKSLYNKWIEMFAGRLLETVPLEQIKHLADGSEENKAALILVFLMFLESERMEKQIEEDLAEYGRGHSHDPDMGQAAAAYIRASMAKFAEDLKKKNGNEH